jgi:hypothetical protein
MRQKRYVRLTSGTAKRETWRPAAGFNYCERKNRSVLGVFQTGIGEKKKKVGHISKYVPCILKYLRPIFGRPESACREALGKLRHAARRFNISRHAD